MSNGLLATYVAFRLQTTDLLLFHKLLEVCFYLNSSILLELILNLSEIVQIRGLPEAFDTPGVCSNYHYDHVQKTLPAMQRTLHGNALFTYPNTPIKCDGAPQKIAYIADDFFRKVGGRR